MQQQLHSAEYARNKACMTLHCFMSLQSLTLSSCWCCPQAAELTGPPRAKPVGKTPAFLATVRTTVDQLRQVG